MFGLTNSEGNHGEDVKEYWFYVDSTPTHSYLKCSTSIRSAAFPYARPRRDQRGARQAATSSTSCWTPASSTTIATSTSSSSTPRRPRTTSLMLDHRRTTAGPRRATLHLLPTLWFRNTWSWGDEVAEAGPRRPSSRRQDRAASAPTHAELGRLGASYADARTSQLLFCENETNNERLFGVPNASPVRQGRDQRLRRATARRRRGESAERTGPRRQPTTC